MGNLSAGIECLSGKILSGKVVTQKSLSDYKIPEKRFAVCKAEITETIPRAAGENLFCHDSRPKNHF
jgi:hypothetical protein